MAGQQNSGGFMAGFVFGTFVGAVLGLLFAPTSGEEARERIREKSMDLTDEFGIDPEKWDELRNKGLALIEEQRKRFQEAVEEGKLAAERKKEELLAQLEAQPVEATFDTEVGGGDAGEL